VNDRSDEPTMPRREFLQKAAGVAIAATTVGTYLTDEAFAASAPELAPWDPNAPGGPAPDLPARVAFAKTDSAQLFVQFEYGMKLGAQDAGLEYLSANAGSDPAKQVDQIETFLRRGICGLLIGIGDAAAQEAAALKAIDQGVAVFTIVTPPATTLLNANQATAGKQVGLLAAKHIKEKLGGNAEIVYFNTDTAEAQRPRHAAALAALQTAGPGAKVVADIQPAKFSSDSAFEAMTTILQAHPNVKVILGPDQWASGALAAIEAAGKVTPDMYIGGWDGEPEMLARIKDSKPPTVTDFAFPTEVNGYAYATFASLWRKGKSIPMGLSSPPYPLTNAAVINEFTAMMKDPGTTYRTKHVITLYGNISYATKDNYLRSVWVPPVTEDGVAPSDK
jgi:ribose transport system substrate-binding protein